MSFASLDFKYLLIIVSASLVFLLVFLFFLPNLQKGEEFSQIWVLGPEKEAVYSKTIVANETYKFNLVLISQIQNGANYAVHVKIIDPAESGPDVSEGMPSVAEPIFEYRQFIAQDEEWEKEVTFSVVEIAFESEFCTLSRIILDGQSIDINKTLVWDREDEGFHSQLLFELWIYDDSISKYRFDNNCVWVWLNFTEEA